MTDIKNLFISNEELQPEVETDEIGVVYSKFYFNELMHILYILYNFFDTARDLGEIGAVNVADMYFKNRRVAMKIVEKGVFFTDEKGEQFVKLFFTFDEQRWLMEQVLYFGITYSDTKKHPDYYDLVVETQKGNTQK